MFIFLLCYSKLIVKFPFKNCYLLEYLSVVLVISFLRITSATNKFESLFFWVFLKPIQYCQIEHGVK